MKIFACLGGLYGVGAGAYAVSQGDFVYAYLCGGLIAFAMSTVVVAEIRDTTKDTTRDDSDAE